MKHFFLYIICFLILADATAQSLHEIAAAFKNNNPDYISKQLDNTVEITKGSVNSTFTRAEATRFLGNFISQNKVNDLKVLHSGENKGSAYLIGNLLTTGGNYRITLYSKQKQGKPVLQEIRLEK